MKKLLFIAVIALSMLSCTHKPNNGASNKPTYIVIIEFKSSDDSTICWYRAQTKGGILPGQKLWFTDTIGKYKIGEVLNK